MYKTKCIILLVSYEVLGFYLKSSEVFFFSEVSLESYIT